MVATVVFLLSEASPAFNKDFFFVIVILCLANIIFHSLFACTLPGIGWKSFCLYSIYIINTKPAYVSIGRLNHVEYMLSNYNIASSMTVSIHN